MSDLDYVLWLLDQEAHARRCAAEGWAPPGLVYLPHPDLAAHLDLEAQPPGDPPACRLPAAVARYVPWESRVPWR